MNLEACIEFLQQGMRVEQLRAIPLATLERWSGVLHHWSVMCDEEIKRRNEKKRVKP